MGRRRLVPLTIAVLLAGCGGEGADGDGGATTTVETATTTVDAAPTKRCENVRDGYAVAYPADWHTNAGDVLPACSYFHPVPFELRPGTEALEIAIRVDREPIAFDLFTEPGPTRDEQSREELELAGRPAVRVVYTATGEGLLPRGVRGYEYAVDLDGDTLVLSTLEAGEADFERSREVLDAMAESLELLG